MRQYIGYSYSSRKPNIQREGSIEQYSQRVWDTHEIKKKSECV
jgi:hypothetical protein